MEGLSSSFGISSGSKWNFETLTSFGTLSPSTQHHLKKVYLTLCGALLLASAGVYCHLALALGGILTHLATLGCILWLNLSPPTPANQTHRLKILFALSFFQGCSIGPLMEMAIAVDSGIVASAFLGTAAIFGCFSGAAVLAKRRSYLFLGGILSSAISIMIMLRFGSWLFGGLSTYFQIELYGGLLLFAGYVLFDTQVMIEKAQCGQMDFVRDSLELFLDFVSIFVRLVIILLRNKVETSRSDERRKSRSNRR